MGITEYEQPHMHPGDLRCLRSHPAHLAVLLAIALACGTDHPTRPLDRWPDSIEVDPDTVVLEAINDSAFVTAVIRDDDGQEIAELTPGWIVGDERVATVDNGLVVAHRAGTTSAQVAISRSGHRAATTVVIIVRPRARTWQIAPGNDAIGVGGHLGLVVIGYDSRGTLVGQDSALTWTTSDPAVASIDNTGLITGISLGTTTVQATTAEGSTTTNVAVVPRSGVRVFSGELNSCALSPAGEAYCWGFNDRGQVGTRDTPDACFLSTVLVPFPCALAPRRVEGGLTFRKIAIGTWHACALDPEGRAFCWGSNAVGQLGRQGAPDICLAADYYTLGPCSFAPLPVVTSERFQDIGVGRRTTCGLTTDQRILCWGDNHEGIMALPVTTWPTWEPTEVRGGLRYRSFVMSPVHVCAIATDGGTRCWGGNEGGLLGEGTLQPRYTPTRIVPDHGFDLVSAGSRHTCAYAIGQGPYCWGAAVGIFLTGAYGYNGESSPLPTVDRTPADTMVSGHLFSCGLFSGWVRCWGNNQAFGLGADTPGDWQTRMPIALGLRASFEQISAGGDHGCGVRTGGAVYCWGTGNEGQLGDGQDRFPLKQSLPVRVPLPFR